MRFPSIYIRESLRNIYRYITKEIIISDNCALLHHVSLYLLISIITYIYLVVNPGAYCYYQPLPTKYLRIWSRFPPLFPIFNNGKTNPPHIYIKWALWHSWLPKNCSLYHSTTVGVNFWCLIQEIIPIKKTEPMDSNTEA